MFSRGSSAAILDLHGEAMDRAGSGAGIHARRQRSPGGDFRHDGRRADETHLRRFFFSRLLLGNGFLDRDGMLGRNGFFGVRKSDGANAP